MNSVFATSIWLYLGDVLWPATLVIGIASLCNLAATITKRHIVTTITAPQLQKFCYYQIAWLFASLVLFKAMILEGGPGFTHLVGTGNHGSVQFSTAGELAAAAATIYGLTRWVRWTMRHITTRRHA